MADKFVVLHGYKENVKSTETKKTQRYSASILGNLQVVI